MAALSLPADGLVYADTPVLICTVERHPTYWRLLRPLWESAARGEVRVVSSEIAIAEVLVWPLRSGDTRILAAYEGLLLGTDIRLQPIARATLRVAARLRAESALRTPDAIHAATAILTGCALFVTNDKRLRHLDGVPVAVLDDLLA